MQENNNQQQTFNLYPLMSEQENNNELTNSMFVPIGNEELGINNPNYQLEEKQKLESQLDSNEINKQSALPTYDGAENKNPSAWDVTKDIGKGLVEGIVDGVVVGSWAGLVADEDTINIFETQTAAGDFVKTATKYITAGALAFTSGSALGVGTKLIAKKAGKNLLGKGARQLLGKRKFYRGTDKITDTLINKIFNPRNIVAGAYADYMAYNPKEGHLADILSANGIDNPLVNYLSADVEDSVFEAKVKNVAEGLIISPFISVGTDVLIPRLTKSFKDLKLATKTENIKQVVKSSKEINTVISQNDLIGNVQEAIRRAGEEQRDPQEIIREILPDDKYADADFILETLQNGETVIPNPDGSYSVKINNWEDAYKITQEEFNNQLMSGYDELGNAKSIVEMEKGYSQILKERGLQQLDNEPNEKYFNRIADYYTKKWEMPNDKKISVEIVDNIKGNRQGKTRFNAKNNTIDIKINANSRNKLSVLRAELEHARDYAFENFKDKNPDQHFYRYAGKNEEEWAKEYLHKKSVSHALRNGFDVPEHVLKTFNVKNIDKPASTYWKESENNFIKNLTPQEKENQKRLFNLLAQATEVSPKYIKRLFTATKNGSKSAERKLEFLLEKARTGDYFSGNHVFSEHQDLFVDELGFSPKFQVDEIGHDEEFTNLIADRIYNNDYRNKNLSIDNNGYAKELEKQEIVIKVQTDFYDNFYKELEVASDSLENLDKCRETSINKINALETIDDSTKAEMIAEVDENINLFKENLKEKQVFTETVENADEFSKSIEKTETPDSALEAIGENLTKENTFNSPELIEQAIHNYIKKIKTRTFEEASEKAQECEKFISAHLSDENFSSDELIKIINNDLGKSEGVSDRILAFTEILGKIKLICEDLNKQLAINPNNIEALEKLSNLTDSYSYIDNAILKERSHAGRALNEIKLFNKAYRFYTKGDGFERNLTASQRENLEATTDLFSRTFKEIYEEFFTTNNRPPTSQEITEYLIKRLSAKNKDIDVKNFDISRLNVFAEHILKSIKDIPLEKHSEIIRKYFRIYNKSDILLNYVQGASLTQNITGLHAFKKNFGSNLAHYYVGNILSSPGTQIANTLSGVVNMAFENSAKAIGGLKSANTELVAEAADTVSGYLKFWSESLQFAIKVFKSEQGIIADTRKYGIEINPFNQMEFEDIKPLSAKSMGVNENNWLGVFLNVTGGILRGSGRIMAATDEFLSQLNYRGLAWADALKTARRELGTNASSKDIENLASQYFSEQNRYLGVRNDATNANLLYEARKLIYQNNLNRKIVDPMTGEELKMEDTSWVSNFGNLFEQARLKMPVLKFVMPFVRTPFNILEQVVDYTPAAQFTYKYKHLDSRAKAIADAKMLIGGAMITISTMSAFAGKITGSAPTDDNARKTLMQSGWQPYSFVVNNPDGSKSYVSYKRLEPLASIIGLGADIANLINIGTMEDADIATVCKKFSLALLQNAMDKSYLNQGLDILDLLTISNDSDIKKMQSVINNFAGGFMPLSSGINWFKNGEYIRDTRAFVDTLSQRSIFMSNDGVMPSRNYFGEIRPLSGKMANTLTRITTQQNDDADKEIIRLSSMGATISSPKRLLGNDNEIDTTTYRNSDGQTAYDAILANMSEIEIHGKNLREAVNELVNSEYYQSLPDGVSEDEDQLYNSRKKALNKLLQKYAKRAQQKVLNSGEFVNESGIDLDTSFSNWKRSRRMTTLSDELQEIF